MIKMKGKSLFYIVGRQYLDHTTYLYANGEFILWGSDNCILWKI